MSTLEFVFENGAIIAMVEGEKIDVTEKVMPVVDDYLDYRIDLKFKTT